jgi:hypothetical protein
VKTSSLASSSYLFAFSPSLGDYVLHLLARDVCKKSKVKGGDAEVGCQLFCSDVLGIRST